MAEPAEPPSQPRYHPHNERLLAAALDYATRGWPVFPCSGKNPATKHGCLDATTDPDTIREWWQGKCFLCNVAIAMGGLIWALDVDPDDDGDASLNRLERKHDLLPETVRSNTGGGGEHYLFAMNGTAIRNSVGKQAGIADGLDTRGDGGYIIAPPSIHPDTKVPYRWEAGYGPEDIEPAEAPPWLEALAKRPERPDRIIREGRRRTPQEGPASPYGQSALDGEILTILEAPGGAQEATLNAAGLKIGGLVAGGELDEDHAFNALLEAALKMPSHNQRKPWKPRVIEKKLMRSMADGSRTPRIAPERRKTAPPPHEAAEAPQASPNEARPPEQRTIRAIPLGKLSEMVIPPRRFAIGRRLQYGEVTLGVSPGGVGKTSLVVTETIAWLVNRPLTGETIRPRGKAWIITAEEPMDEMRRRVKATCQHFGIDPDALEGRLFITSTRDNGPFRVAELGGSDSRNLIVETKAPDDVIAELLDNDIGYLAVDPFVTTHGVPEDNNGAMDRVARIFNRIAHDADCCINLLHHVVKSEDPEAHVGNLAKSRGAGAVTNAIRHAYTIASINEATTDHYKLTPDEAVRLLRLDAGLKGNYVLKPTEPLWFWRTSVPLDNAMDGWEADEVGVLRPFSMGHLQAERHRREQEAREPDRNTIAQLVADAMPEGRILVAKLLPLLKDRIDCGETKRREVINDAIPLAPGHRAVRIGGESGRVYRARTVDHPTAPVEVVRQIDP
jgi:hypothetical protein